MADRTARFLLPLLVPGQAQKDITHNESVSLIAGLLHPIVESIGSNAPPLDAADGQAWVVGSSGTGAWAGHNGELATLTAGGWRFLPLSDGLTIWDRQSARRVRRMGDQWFLDLPKAAEAATISPATGGANVDIEARTTLTAVLDRLRAVGILD